MSATEILAKYEDENEYHFHEVDRTWIIEAMTEYGKQVAKASLQEASKNAKTKLVYHMYSPDGFPLIELEPPTVEVDKQSITNPENIKL